MNQLFVLAALHALDGGARDASTRAPPTSEELEIIADLELLQNLEGAGDLELLEELSAER
jgi:hypothetical protein